MISFYPGPSKVYEQVPQWTKEAYNLGLLSINHRSKKFAEVLELTHKLLRQKLNIPSDYSIHFVSSATECWEIIAQSFIENESLHVYNGAFGEKWMDYTRKIVKKANVFNFNLNEKIDINQIPVHESTEVICLTHNETSNGTEISKETIKVIKKVNPSKLVAVDATSSLGGVNLDINDADICIYAKMPGLTCWNGYINLFPSSNRKRSCTWRKYPL
jgi:phosphoserine aminotransferase